MFMPAAMPQAESYRGASYVHQGQKQGQGQNQGRGKGSGRVKGKGKRRGKGKVRDTHKQAVLLS